MNKKINPIAHSMGASYFTFDPWIVASHLNTNQVDAHLCIKKQSCLPKRVVVIIF